LLKNADGEGYLLLSKNRRVTVRKYKGAVLVDIRETYDKDGQEGLPGKKGIALSLEQWRALKQHVDVIDTEATKLQA